MKLLPRCRQDSVTSAQMKLAISDTSFPADKGRLRIGYANAAKTQWNSLTMMIPILPRAMGNLHKMGKFGMFSPKKKTDYMMEIVSRIRMLMEKIPIPLPIDCLLQAEWLFVLPRPKSKQRKNSHTYERIGTSPDGDNYVKTIKDCLQKKRIFKRGKKEYFGAGLITNDSIITKNTDERIYGPRPCIILKLTIKSKACELPPFAQKMLGGDR